MFSLWHIIFDKSFFNSGFSPWTLETKDFLTRVVVIFLFRLSSRLQLVAFWKKEENWSPIRADDIVLPFQLRNTQLSPDLVTPTNIFLIFWINMQHSWYSCDVKTIAAGPDVAAVLWSVTRTIYNPFSSMVALLNWLSFIFLIAPGLDAFESMRVLMM